MIESAVRSGADVFVRDARGRGVEEVVILRPGGNGAQSRETLSKGSNKEWKAEGDRIKVFLRQRECDYIQVRSLDQSSPSSGKPRYIPSATIFIVDSTF